MSEGDANVFDPERAFKLMSQFGHSGALGLVYHDHGPDWAALRLPWRPEITGDAVAQTAAGGAIVALFDMAAGLAVWTRLTLFRPQVTLDLRVDHIRPPAPARDVIARVECYRVAREIAFVRGEAFDREGGDPIATMAASFMFIGDPIPFSRKPPESAT